MQFAFQKMRLEADRLNALVSTWVEMQLEVTEEAAVITGDGFDQEIADAFTTLVPDWEASIFIPREEVDLEPGTYELFLIEEELYACRDKDQFWLADGPVVVEVVTFDKEKFPV